MGLLRSYWGPTDEHVNSTELVPQHRAKLKQDYLGKNPLCMAQYTKVFSGCRIPGLPKDSIRQCHDAQHIVVAFNNHVN